MWDRLKKKTVCFNGKFDWGVRERLSALAKENGASIAKDLNARVGMLVVPDISGAKTIQKKVQSLNARGAAIQLLDADDFSTQVAPTDDEIVAVMKRGAKGAKLFQDAIAHYARRAMGKQPTRIIAGESFIGADLRGFDLEDFGFDSCDFSRAKFERTKIGPSSECKFEQCTGIDLMIESAQACSFKKAKLPSSDFADGSDLDFTGSDFSESHFSKYGFAYVNGKMTEPVFRDANLKGCEFEHITMVRPNFSGAKLDKATFDEATIDSGDFTRSSLADAQMSGSKFKNCNFSGADLSRANLADADLSGANFDGANLTGANLRGANLSGAQLAKAKGYDANAQATVTAAGPALKELDKAIAKAKRIKFKFQLAQPPQGAHPKAAISRIVTGDSSNLEYGWAISTALVIPRPGRMSKTTMSADLLAAARVLGDIQIRFETLEIETTKSKLKANEFREVLTKALCEAFAQTPPDGDQLAGLIKSHRQKQLKATAGMRKKREAAKQKAEAAKQRELKKVETKVAKAVGGKVTDLASFLKALEVRAEKAKIDKATKMLKAERFQLFNDITDSHMSGVVKSQTDPDLVYACRLESDGHYACCTQNLNICGGLRGSVCKHLLVLIIGLTKAGALDPAMLDGWLSKTHKIKPELNKETMGEIFIRYKGAEAGEVDWRPTETVPEDYYTL